LVVAYKVTDAHSSVIDDLVVRFEMLRILGSLFIVVLHGRFNNKSLLTISIIKL
jgi:hypothetical protein